MSRSPFRRFGIVGVFVVAGLCIVVAQNMGTGQANPKGAYALIFGIIATFVVLMFVFQSRDLSAVEAAESGASAPAATTIVNPATMTEPELWAAMATGPIDDAAIRRARRLTPTVSIEPR